MSENASDSIPVNDVVSNTNDDKFTQLVNADGPIYLTRFGIVIELIGQLLNADWPISATDAGRTTDRN